MLGKIFLKKVKKSLLEQKELITNQIQKEQDEIDVEGDEVDIIAGNQLIQMNNQLELRNLAKLDQINKALIKLDHNSYGICIDCEELISEKRLMINHYAQTCISCAEQREMDQKQR